MKHQMNVLWITLLLPLFCVSVAHSTFYSCTDEEGKKVFQSYPCEDDTVTQGKDTKAGTGDAQKIPTIHRSSRASEPLGEKIFRAVITSRENEKKVTITERVDYPFLFKENSSGYWTGILEFTQAVSKTIDIFQGEGETELLIDDQVIWSGRDSSISIPFEFSAGIHKIELKTRNVGPQATTFLATINDPVVQIERSALTSILRSYPGAELHYCGVTGSSSPDGTVKLDLGMLVKPTILILSSSNAVVWEFLQGLSAHIPAIVVSSAEFGTTLKNIPQNAQVYHFKDITNATSLATADKNFKKTFKYAALQIQSLAGKKPDGFAGGDKVVALTVPEIALSQSRLKGMGLAIKPSNFDVYMNDPEGIDLVFEPDPGLFEGGKSAKAGLVEYQREQLLKRASWGKWLNPSGEIPENSFGAFYFDIDNPLETVIAESVREVTLKVDETLPLKNINLGTLGGYWIGNMTLQENSRMRVDLYQRNGFSRVLVDGEVILREDSPATAVVELEQGQRTIEVEHVSKGGVVSFTLALEPYLDSLTYEEIQEKLSEILPEMTHVGLITTQTSNNKNNSIPLKMNNIGKPVLLILNSWDPVHWRISGPGRELVKAVLLSSHAPLSRIDGLTGEVPIFHFPLHSGTSGFWPECDCQSTTYTCLNDDVLSVLEDIRHVTGRSVDSFTGDNSAGDLVFPAMFLDAPLTNKLKSTMTELEAKRGMCEQSQPESEVDTGPLEELPPVRNALRFIRAIQHNDFAAYSALKLPGVGAQHKDTDRHRFVSLRNTLFDREVVVRAQDNELIHEYADREEVEVSLLAIRKGRNGIDVQLKMARIQGDWKVR